MKQQELYAIITALPGREDVVSVHLLDILNHRDARRVVNERIEASNASVTTPFEAFLIEACLLGNLSKDKRRELLEAFLRAGADARRGKKAVREFSNVMAGYGYPSMADPARELLRMLDGATSLRFNPVVRARYFGSMGNLDLQQMINGHNEPGMSRSYTA